MQIINKFTSLLGGNAKSAPARSGYRSEMVIESGDTAYNTAAKIIALLPAVGVKLRIWEYTVPAQSGYTWGFGNPNEPENEGFIFFVIGLAGTGVDIGTVLLGHENHSRRNIVPIDEFNDSTTHTATSTTLATLRTTDRRLLRALPEGGSMGANAPIVGQDSRLTIDYTAITLVAEDIAGFTIPVTVY